MLAYPLFHASLPPLREELAQKIAALPPEARFDSAAVGAINLNYVQDPADLSSPYAFPGGHDLHGLPPTFVLTCEHDGLRASGETYASELAAVGVDLLLVREDGTRHGHLNDPDHPAAARNLSRVATWLTDPTRAGLPSRGPAAARQHRVQ